MSQNNAENGEESKVASSSWGGFGGLKNLGESLRSQAEELNSKAKEALTNPTVKMGLSVDTTTPAKTDPTSGTAASAPATPANSTGPMAATTENAPADVAKALPSPSAGNANPLSTRDPKDFSKEEYMVILQKMNKRVKSLSSLRESLIQRVKAAENDKNRLMTLVKEEILTETDLAEATQRAAKENAKAANKAAENDAEGGSAEGKKTESFDEIAMMRLAWRAADERNQMSLQQIQTEYKVISMQCQADVEKAKAISEAEKVAEIEQIRAQLQADATSKEAKGGDVSKVVIDGAVKRATESIEARNKEVIGSIKSEMQMKHNLSLKRVEEEMSTEKNKLVLKIMDETSIKVEKLEAELAQKKLDADSEQGKLVTDKERELKAADHKADLKRLEVSLKEQFTAQLSDIEAGNKANAEVIVKESETKASHLQGELEQSQSELSKAKNEIQTLKQSGASEMKLVKEELEKHRNEEVERLTVEADNTKKGLHGKLKQSQSELSKAKNEIQTLKQSGASEMKQVKEELEKRIHKEVERVTVEADNTKKGLHGKLEQSQSELSKAKNEIQALQQSGASEMKQVKEELEKRIHKEVERVTVEADSTKKETEQTLRNERELALKKLSNKLISAHKIQLKQSKAHAATQLESLRTDLAAATKASIEDALSKARSAHESKVAQANSEAESNRVALEEELKSSHAKSIGLLRQTSELETKKIKELLEKEAGEQLNKLKLNHNSKLNEMLTKVDSTSQLLEDATNDSNRLQSELDNEKSKAVSVAAKLEAMSTAAKDGDSMTSKKLEDAISKQSAQFEQTLNSQKEKHQGTVTKLQDKHKQNLMSLKEKEKSITSLKDSIKSEQEKVSEEKNKSKKLSEINLRFIGELKKSQSSVKNIQNEAVTLKEQCKGACAVRDEMTDNLKACKQEMAALIKKHEKDTEITQGAQEIKVTKILEERSSQLSQVEKMVTTYKSEIEELMNTKTNLSTELEARQVKIEDLTQAENDVLAHVKRLQKEKEKANEEHNRQVQNLLIKHTEEIMASSSESESATNLLQLALEKKHQDTQSDAVKEIASLQSSVKEMRNEILKKQANHEIGVKKLQEESASTVKEVCTKMEELHIKRDTMKADHQTQLKKMQTKCNAENDARLLENKNVVNKLKEKLDSIKSANAREGILLKDSIQNASNEIQKVQTKHKNEVKKLQDEAVSKLTLERTKLQTLQDEKDCALVEYNKELENLQVKHKQEIASSLSNIDNGTNAILEQHKKELESVRSSSAKEIASLQEAIHNAHNEIKNMQDKHQCDVKNLQDESASSLITAGDEQQKKNDSILEAKDKKLDEIKLSLTHAESSSSKAIASLQDQIKCANSKIENMQNEHNSEVKKLQDTASSSLTNASDKNSLLLQEKLDFVHSEKEKELEELKLDYEKQMTALENGKKKALDFAKKMKDAFGAKLKKAEKDAFLVKEKYVAQITELKGKNDSLRSDIEKELTLTMNEAHAADISSLTTNLEEKIKLDKIRYEEELKKASDEKYTISKETEDHFKCKVKELEATVESAKQEARLIQNNTKVELEKQAEALRKEHQEDSKQLINDMKANFQERIKGIEKEHTETRMTIQQKMSNHIDELKKHYEGKVHHAQNELNTTKSQLGRNLSLLEQKLSQTQAALTSLSVDKETLDDSLKQQIMSKLAIGKELENVKKDLEEASATNAATTTSLLEYQEKLTKENEGLKQQVSKLSKDILLKMNSLEEVNGMLRALQTNLNCVAEEKKVLQARLNTATKQVTKLNATEMELGVAREEVNRLKLDQAQSSGLLSRLQSEKDSSEKNHGQRTALVGMLEAQVSELNDNVSESRAHLEAARYDLSQKDDELKDMKNELEKAENMFTQNQLSRQKNNDQVTQNADKDALKKARMVETLQRELQLLQQQMARKSSAAQRLLQERESECKELRKRSKTLQQELDKGSLSDRRIFELAAQQSNRESVAASEIDIRNTLVEQLTEKLASRDGDLASVEYQTKKVESEVEDLCRIRRREDINVDYLKSIIVQYLSKPPGSSERGTLLPVIATLLQVRILFVCVTVNLRYIFSAEYIFN